jgi:hypothetical protein
MELVHSSKDKKEARSQYTGECMRSQAVAYTPNCYDMTLWLY